MYLGIKIEVDKQPEFYLKNVIIEYNKLKSLSTFDHINY
jgi:hypothetical protein